MIDVKANAACLKLLALVVSAYGCALTLLIAPRSADGSVSWAVAAEPELDCQTAEAVDDAWQQVLPLLRASTRAELGPGELQTHHEARRAELHRASLAALARNGEAGLTGFLTSATCSLTRALRGEVQEAERPALLGVFLDELLRERVIDENGRLQLPLSVVQALYCVRVNLQLGFFDMRGIPEALQRSYFGMLAWHAPTIDGERRLHAASAYEKLGGVRAGQARAYALARVDRAGAAASFREIYARTGELRARNVSLALTR